MYRIVLSRIFVLVILCFTVNITKACNQEPTAELVCTPAITWLGNSIVMDASGSSDPDGTIVKFEWDWSDDDIFDYTESPGDGIASYTYIESGTYDVVVRVTDDDGAWSETTVQVTVYAPQDEEVAFYVNGEIGNNIYDGKSPAIADGHGPKATIQATIDAVGAGTDNFGYIEVAPWTYGEKIDFGGKNIILTSEDPDDYSVVSTTIIDGLNQSPNPKSTVTFSGSEDNHTELRGFTITGGNGTEYPDPGSLCFGGGIWGEHTTATISRCIITGNTVNGYGGAMSVCNGLIERCTIINNTATLGGGALHACFYGTIKNCIIASNHSTQRAGGLDSCWWNKIVNCTIVNNDHYGMYNCNNGDTITNCIIWGNADGSLYDCAHPTYSCIQNYTLNDYQGMLAYWRLDENGGLEAGDFLEVHDGSVTAALWQPGVIGSSLWFDGTGDYVTVPDDAAFDTGDELTVAHWFSTDTPQSGKGMFTHDNSNYKYMSYITTNSTNLQFYVRQSSGVFAATANRATWADDQWYHFVGTFNKGQDDGNIRIYIDGELYAVGFGPLEDILDGDEGILLGRWTSGHDFTGKLDEVAIYDRALSPGEVPQLYQQSLAGGDYGLETNINLDPQFVDSGEGDYHLQMTSPCINGGDATFDYSQELYGGDGRINMGAYGNTHEAALLDLDGDEMPDAWEVFHWPGDDPAEHGPADDPDEDGLANLVEYQIGWNPTQDDSDSITGYVTNCQTGYAYPSIQDALDWAEDDAAEHIEFVLSTDRFYESIDFTYRNISLISSDPTNPAVVHATILDGNGQDVLTFVGAQADSCIVSGITITGGARGIYCESAAPTIRHCVIRNNQQGGLYCCNNSQPDVSNCFFYRNISSDNGGAIYNDSSNPTITNCVLVENKADNGGGIYNTSSSPTIRQCTIYRNTAKSGQGGAVYNGSYSYPVFTNSILWGNRASISGGEVFNMNIFSVPQFDYCCVEGRINGRKCSGIDSTDALTNTCEDPLFVDVYRIKGPDRLLGTSDDGLHLQPGSFCVDAAKLEDSPITDITGRVWIDIPGSVNQVSEVDKGAYESELVWYVKSDAAGTGTGISWVNAFTDIQQALAQTQGTEIWVATGVYQAGPAQSDTFTLKNATNEPVQLYGGFRGGEGARYQRDGKKNTTILDGTEVNYHVVIGVAGAVIDGFVIQGGRADGAGVDGCGGGMINDGVATTIANCRFRNNYALQGGGMWNQNSSALVLGCRFESNEAVNSGGGMYNNGRSPAVTSCVFAGNISSGNGGGTYNGGSSGEFARCVFYNNAAENGAGIFNSSSDPEIENCVFYGNAASNDGGGMSNVNQSDADIINCTFTRNEANRGGAFFNDASSPTVINAILWEDSASEADFGNEVFNQNDAAPVFSFCAIQTSGGSVVGTWNSEIGLDGGYNIDRDPMFEDALHPIGADEIWGTRDDGLHLRCYNTNPKRRIDQVYRSCLDAANGDMAPTVDLTGRIRNDIGYIADFGVGQVDYADIGAYESPTVWYVNAEAQGKGTGACWEDALWDMQDALKTAGNFNYVMDPNDLDPNSFYSEEIWIAAGTYTPYHVTQGFVNEIAKSTSFQMKVGVDLYGGFAGGEHSLNQRDGHVHETILSGDLRDDGPLGNSYHVIRAANNVSLDGFTITGGVTKYNSEGGGGIYQDAGELLVRNCLFSENGGSSPGGAICCMDGALTVENCVFSDNEVTTSGGGGIFCGGVLEIFDSEFTGNSATGVGGGIYFKGSLLRAENCSWVNNTTDSSFGGGGIYNRGYRMQMYRCVFQQNAVMEMSNVWVGNGGAIRNIESYDVAISSCLFEQNQVLQSGGEDIAGYGGAISNKDNVTGITNCVFLENEAYRGGAVHNEDDSQITIANCTFHQNIAADTGGAVYNDAVNPYIVNSILWQDQAVGGGDEIYNVNDAEPIISFCDISGGGGTDCIDVDPQFKSVGDLLGPDHLWGTYDDGCRLQSGSGCIDAATNTILRDPNVSAWLVRDLQEVPRQQHGGLGIVIDMGAYEFGGIITQDQTDLETDEDTPYTFTPIASHIGSTPLTFYIETEPEHGTVEINSDGTLTYDPDPDYYGNDSFRYRAADGMNSESVLIELNVAPINDPPCAVDDVIDVKQNDEGVTSVTFNVLDNDNAAHPDGDSATMDPFTEQSSGQYTISGDAAGNVTFDWEEDYTNLPGDGDIFTYRITDPQQEEAFGTITIRLHTAPEAVADNSVMLQGQICTIDVFANDTDSDEDSLMIGDWSYPDPVQSTDIHGTIVYHGDGIFTYCPHWDFVGTDYFTYRLRDSVGNESEYVSVAIAIYTPETLPVEYIDDVTDTDGDGIPDNDELYIYETSATSADYDGDGLWDGWEIHWFQGAESVVDPYVWDDPYVDPDGDDLDHQEEFYYATNPQQADTDGDGINDGIEIVNGTNPLQPDEIIQPYYAHSVPYQTSFDYGDFIWYESIDTQQGWQVVKGDAQVEGRPASNLFLDHDAMVSKLIADDNFPTTTYVKVTLALPWVKEDDAMMGANAEIRIRAGDEIIAGVKFEDKNPQNEYLISVWDNQQGAYVVTNTSWEQMFEWWCELWFELDFNNDRYKVHWYEREYQLMPSFSSVQGCEPEVICDYYDFDNLPETDYVSFEEIQFETKIAPGTGGGEEEGGCLAINTLSVSGRFNANVDTLIAIESPCHCDGQISKARVPVIGRIEWDRLDYYELGFCPGDLDPYDSRNWFWFDWGTGMVETGILGYWNTGRWPNGYYYLGIIIYDEIGHGVAKFYAQQYDNSFGPYGATAPLAPILIYNNKPFDTFVHVEKPEISVPWPGQFPFELKLIYNDRTFGWPSPIHTGWSHNHQISLVEDTRYYWASPDSNFGIPYADDHLLAYGDVWITFGGGSKQLFRYSPGQGVYYPYRGDGIDTQSGIYLERVSHAPGIPITQVDYILHQRDGTKITFTTAGNFEIGLEYLNLGGTFLGWKLQAYIQSLSDRFGNTLTYNWDTRYEYNPAVMSVEYDPDGNGGVDPIGIYFEKPDYYYTKAELRSGEHVYRTINFDFHNFTPMHYSLKVWHSGRGVDSSGELHSNYDFARYTRHYLPWIYGLAKTVYADDVVLNTPGNTYFFHDAWGRLENRLDLLGQFDYLRTFYTFEYYNPQSKDYDPINGVPGQEPWMKGEPNPNYDYVSYLKKTTTTYLSSDVGEEPYRQITTFEDENGATVRQETTIEEDDICVSTSNLAYEHPHRPYLPTLIEEIIEQPGQPVDVKRYTTNVYNVQGELISQYVSDEADYTQAGQCVHTERTYHPAYGFVTSEVTNDRDGDVSKRREVQYIFGRYENGEPIPNLGVPISDDKFLLMEKVLLDGVADTWATTTYNYDEQTGQLIEKIDPRGFRTVYEYDAHYNLNRIRVGEAGSEQTVQIVCYDKVGQLIWQADTYGKVTRNYYDDIGHRYCVRTYADPTVLTLGQGASGYNDPNRYDNIEDPSYTLLSTVWYGYDNWGNRTYHKTATEGVIRTEYTRSHQPEKIHYDLDADGEVDPAESYIEYQYDNAGRKDGERHHYAADDLNPQRDAYALLFYDPLNRLRDSIWLDYGELETANLLKIRTTDYDGTGRKVKEEIGGPVFPGGTLGCRENHFQYDIYDHLLQRELRTNEDGEPYACDTTQYEYDFAGHRTAVIDPKENVTYTDYDNAGRVTAKYFTAEPETPKAQAVLQELLTYYPDNSLTVASNYDTDGQTVLAYSTFDYDNRGRLTQVEQFLEDPADPDPEKAVTAYEYQDPHESDKNQYRIEVVDAETKSSYRYYDTHGNVAETIYPHPTDKTVKYEYDGNGTLNRQNVYDSSGSEQWINYDYDNYGRMTNITYPSNGGQIEYTYNGLGRRIQIEDTRVAIDNIGGSGTITFDYDPLGRLVNKTDQDDYQVCYSYRGDNQKLSIRALQPGDPQPSEIYAADYAYHPSGRLKGIYEDGADVNSRIAWFGYDDNGNRDWMDYHLDGTEGGDVVRTDYDYNRDNRLTDLTASSYIVGNPSVELFSQNNLIIDGLGRLTQGDESIRNCSQIDITHALAYNYDLLGRLDDATITNINSSTWTGDYNYLKDGNLDNRTINSTPEDFDYTGDLLTTLDTQAIAWDDNGNLKQIDDGTTDTYSFNWDNRLREASVNGTFVWLKYDPDGNRIYKESDDGQTETKRKYIVGEVGGLPVILLEINPTNSQIVKSYVYAQDDLVTQYDGDQAAGQKYFYVCDRLGNVRQVIDVNASVQYLYTYGPFGKVLESDEDADLPGNSFRFTGQFYDADLDQYYLRARQYSPDLSRFTARDPYPGQFNEPATLHAYLYCLDDPINRTDLTGKRSLAELMATTGATVGMWAHQASSAIRRSMIWAQNMIRAINFSTRLRNAWMRTSQHAGRAWQSTRNFLSRSYNNLTQSKESLSNFGRNNIGSSQYGIQSYNQLTKLTSGSDFTAHHIIPRRFAERLGLKAGDLLSVALWPEEHQMFTNLWRNAIYYGTGTANATRELIWQKAQEIYADYPALLEAARTTLGM